jgi:hypothetical protein
MRPNWWPMCVAIAGVDGRRGWIIFAVRCMAESAAATSLAVQRRRENRGEDWIEQGKFAEMLARYLNPSCTAA